MKRLVIWVLALGAAGLALAAGEPKRVAVLDFVRTDSPGSLDPTLQDFSRAVQARLMTDGTWAWVERQEFERLMEEADPGGTRGFDAASAVRLGRLLRADLLLRGGVAQRPGGGAELAVEVVDLRRAEALAVRTVPITMNSRQKIHPTAAEVASAAEAARAVLAEAESQLAQAGSRRVLAPLYFRNTGKSERLGFLEERLQAALAKAATPASGVRVLQFPRSSEAGEESSLVLAGLTDTDPDAWQKVADFYVWGSFQEEPADGKAFEDVPVSITLQISSGTGGLQEVKWRGTVGTLSAGLETISNDTMVAVRTLRDEAAPARPDERQRIAADLLKRAGEAGGQLAAASRDFKASAAGRQLWAYRNRLLEVACFFDPLNRSLQEMRLGSTWDLESPLKPLETLRGQWLRLADYETQARRFSRLPDGGLDPKWPQVQEANVRAFIKMLEQSAWRAKNMGISEEEVYRQLRAVIGRWSELLVRTHQAVQKEPRPPAWYVAQRAAWFAEADFLGWINDPLIQVDALERVWPVLEPEIGRLLKGSSSGDRQRAAGWIDDLFSAYGALGDQNRAKALLDSAWRAAAAPTSGELIKGEKPRAPPPKRADKVWATTPTLKSQFPPVKIPGLPEIPVLEAAIREIDPRAVREFVRGDPGQEPLRKNIQGRIDALAWWNGRLWIAESQGKLPEALGPANPQGDHYLWSYDPALRTTELVSTKLGGHSGVVSLQTADDGLWIGFNSDGAWRLDAAGSVRRFKGEDGLQTVRVQQGTTNGKEVFYLGGSPGNQQISSYSLTEEKWFGLQVPAFPSTGDGAARPNSPKPPTLALSREWLCLSSGGIALYNRTARQWTDLADLRGSRAFVLGDEQGFWCGDGMFEVSAVVFFDPAKPQEKTIIRLPGGALQAMAQDGPWLWAVLNRFGASSQLMLIDKRSKTCVGRLDLPTQNAVCLTMGAGRLWVGSARQPAYTGDADQGLALIEVTAAMPGEPLAENLAQPTDHALARAVWRGGRAAVEQLLAAKADVNEASTSGWTPLMGASAEGRSDLVALLLDAKADPNRLSGNGESALQQAVMRGDAESVRLLLQRGAQPNLRAPTKIQNMGTLFRPKFELPHAPATKLPRRPENLKATATPEGEVLLTWEDRADNETGYEVVYRTSEGMAIVVADLPANSTRWLDTSTRDEAQLTYMIEAVNELNERAPESQQVEVRIVRPKLSENVFRPMYGFAPHSPESMPVRLLAHGPLATAAIAGRSDLVELLLAGGADPNLQDAVGYTPLIDAVIRGQYAVARQLLAKGARPELIGVTGETAASAVYRRHEDEKLLEELLRAMPAGPREEEATLLAGEAASTGQIKDLEKLESLGADFGTRMITGEVPLRRAVASDQLETAQWMFARMAPKLGPRLRAGKVDGPLGDVVNTAVVNNRPEFFAQLLDAGLGVDQNVGGQPLVALAARYKAFAVFMLLRDRGANLRKPSEHIDLGNPENGTALSYLTPEETKRYVPSLATSTDEEPAWPLPRAITFKWPGPAQYVREPDPAKLTVNAALINAAKRGDLPGIMQAVAAGAELDSRGPEGRTPLLEAIKAQAFDAVHWLVEEGASVNRPSKAGYGPVSFAMGSGRPAELEYILRAGGDPNLYGDGGIPPIALAAQDGMVDMVQRLLAAGASPNVSAYLNDRRQSPLAFALLKGRVAVVELLLANGANPRGQTYRFVGGSGVKGGVIQQPDPSLLMYAAAGRNLDLVKRMISLGQDPKFQTDGGWDALSWAAGAGAVDVVEYLLPFSVRNGRAVEAAREGGHGEIVSLLLKSGYTN